MTKVAVVFGGPSPEHDVSVSTGLQAARSLALAGFDRRALYWTKTNEFYDVDPDSEAQDFVSLPRGAKAAVLRIGSEPGFFAGRRRIDVDVVVNCCHGGPGEDGTLQAAFDLAGLRYTGPDAAGAHLGMDKLAFGATVAAVGLPTLPRAVVTPEGVVPEVDFAAPFIVKPRFGGSSIGIEVVDDLDTARTLAATKAQLRRGAVVEPYLKEGRDLNIAIRSFPTLALSAIEEPLRHSEGEILDYRDKYLAGGGLAGAARRLPAEVPAEVSDDIRSMALRVAALSGLRGVARLDFLLSDDGLFVNEINTIPGNLSSYLWIDPPLPFPQLLADLVAEAEQGPAVQFSTAGADGTLLRSARSIADKLGLAP